MAVSESAHMGHRLETPEAESIIEFAEKEIFNGELSDIGEVTYAYSKTPDGAYYNRTVFVDFAGVPMEEGIGKGFLAAKWKLAGKRKLISDCLKSISALPKDGFSDRIAILSGSLEYLDTLLEITEIGLPFEAEKGGLPHGMNEREVLDAVARMENLEAKAFWGNLGSHSEEREASLSALEKEYLENGWRLSAEDRKSYVALFERIGGRPLPLSVDGTEEERSGKEQSETGVASRKIDRESYMEAFKKVFEFYGIEKPVVCDERSSIFDGEDALHIPDSEEYATLPVSRVLALVQHEIETHYLIAKNNERVLGKFRWGGNLEREEWVAVIAEWLLAGESIEGFAKIRTNPQIYAGEILSGDELATLISLMKKMEWQEKPNPLPLLLRRKRNYPMHYRGVQHKDTSYPRWERKTALYVLGGGDVRDLYLAKVSFEDVERAKRIVAKEGIEISYPVLIGEVLSKSLSWKPVTRKEIFAMIREKYPFLRDWLDESGKTEIQVKRKVAAILRTLREKKTA